MDNFNFKIKKIDFVSKNRRIHLSNFGQTNKKTEFKNYAAILRDRIKTKLNLLKTINRAINGSVYFIRVYIIL